MPTPDPSSQFNPLAIDVTAPAKPDPAPAAAPETDTAPTTQAPEPATTTDLYAARRRKAAIVAGIAAVVVWYLWQAQPWQAITATTQAAAEGPVAVVSMDAESVIDADMLTATSYLTEHGNLDGIALDGAQVAALGSTMYAARVVGSDCTVYGILNGEPLAPAVDATGQACAGQIVTVQMQLNEAAYSASTTATDQARDTLDAAAESVVRYTSRNYVNGVPSTSGLPGSVSGALVVANTGEYVVLRASYPSACLEMHVTAAGELSEPTTCP